MSKILPKLYEQASTGKVKHWQIIVRKTGILPKDKVIEHGLIITRYGAGDSKVRTTGKIITKGKNIGRSNETTPYEQALSEAEATWRKKLDKGYVENLANLSDEKLLPMLAHNFKKRKHDISYPAYTQPKLDGVRCLAKKIDDKTIKYYSRMGKEFTTLEHLTPGLLKLMQVNQVLDGEIYSHDRTFQEMIRLLKKLRPESNTLEYHVFDMVDTKEIFKKRAENLMSIFFGMNEKSLLKFVRTEEIKEQLAIKPMHAKYVRLGYEGLIIRNANGMYKLKGRSKDLQKYKEFQDEEFEIIGGQEGTGSEAGCIVFNVKTKKSLEFAVRPRGSFEQRKQWMINLSSLIGKKLTVRFQGVSEEGIPRFPVGISVRDYEN